MKFLVCSVPDDQIGSEGTEKLFKTSEGKLFTYQIEFDDNIVRLVDSIGRTFPVYVEELDSIIFTLARINNYVKNSEQLANFLYEKLVEGYSS
jgi:primosomal protein N''